MSNVIVIVSFTLLECQLRLSAGPQLIEFNEGLCWIRAFVEVVTNSSIGQNSCLTGSRWGGGSGEFGHMRSRRGQTDLEWKAWNFLTVGDWE